MSFDTPSCTITKIIDVFFFIFGCKNQNLKYLFISYKFKQDRGGFKWGGGGGVGIG